MHLSQNLEIDMSYLRKIEEQLTKKSDPPRQNRYHFKFLKKFHRYSQHVLPSENCEKNTEGTSIAAMKCSQIL